MTDPNENRPGYEYSCAMDCWVPASQAGRADGADRFAGASTSTVLNSIREDDAIEHEIQAKKLTAPRVTPQRIEEVIAGEYYFTAADGVAGSPHQAHEARGKDWDALKLLTFCVLVLKNGFTVTGESACASPENFDAAIGCKIARQNAVANIWKLEGYLLKQQLHNDQVLGFMREQTSGK